MSNLHWATILLVVTAILMVFIGLQTKDIGRRAADATEITAQATADAARAAEASAQVAATLAKVELDRRHEEMFPDCSPIECRWEQNPRTGQHSLFAYLTSRARHDYRVTGRLRQGQSSWAASPFLLNSGATVRIFIGEMRDYPEGEVTTAAEFLDLEFESVDPCPCGRPAAADRGHWSRSFEIRYPGRPGAE